jgi:hypothetical protein
MSVLDDFMRMRLYRKRAADFEESAESAPAFIVRHRYRTIARHYKELAEREERLDKARIPERLEQLRMKRQEGSGQVAFGSGKPRSSVRHPPAARASVSAMLFRLPVTGGALRVLTSPNAPNGPSDMVTRADSIPTEPDRRSERQFRRQGKSAQ